MTLNSLRNFFEEYLQNLRLYMETLFGQQIKSVCIPGVEFRHPEEGRTYKVDLIRFQNHFPIALPIESLPYLDIFIDPVRNLPRISVFGKNEFTMLLKKPVEYKQLEYLFVSLIWDAEVTKKGLEVKIGCPMIH